MTTLFEQLVQINSDITEVQAAEFRSCLITVSKHINTEPESLALSLQDWGRWLDDGGYGTENFAAILKQITEAELGVPAASTLWTYAQSIGDAAEGIPSLIEHVQTDYPGLEQRIISLEALALDDQGLIEQTAGGMSKTGQIVAGSVGGVVVGLAVTYGIHRVLQTRRARTARENADAFKLQVEKDAKEATENHIEKMVKMLGETQAKEGGEFDKKIVEGTYRDRSKVFDVKGYADQELAGLTENEAFKLKSELADNIATKFKRSDLEEKLAKDTGNITDVDKWEKIMKKPEFEDYFKDHFHLQKAKEVLSMSEDRFVKFAEVEGKDFYKGGLDAIRKGREDLEIQAEDYFESAVGGITLEVKNNVENDVKRAFINDIEQTLIDGERKAATKLELKVESTATKVEDWELLVDDI